MTVVYKLLLSAGLVGPADQVARSLYNIEISRSDRTVIYETPEGYGLRRGGNPMEMLSNFVVRILGNVAFGDGSALHHSATILVGGKYRERRCQKLNRTRHSRLCKMGARQSVSLCALFVLLTMCKFVLLEEFGGIALQVFVLSHASQPLHS